MANIKIWFVVSVFYILISPYAAAQGPQGQLQVALTPYSEQEVSLAEMIESEANGFLLTISKALQWDLREQQWLLAVEHIYQQEQRTGFDFTKTDPVIAQHHKFSSFRFLGQWTSQPWEWDHGSTRLSAGGSAPKGTAFGGWQWQTIQDPLRIDTQLQLHRSQQSWYWTWSVGSTLAVSHHWQWAWQVQKDRQHLWLELQLLQNHPWGQTIYKAAANPAKSRWQLSWGLSY